VSVFEVGIGFLYSFGIFKVCLVFGISISKYRDIGIGIWYFLQVLHMVQLMLLPPHHLLLH